MKKWLVLAASVAIVSIAAVALAAEELVAAKAQDTCPVMGGPVTKSQYADYNGKRVYFCCGGCVKTFNASPDKYIKKLQEDGVQLEDAPSK